MYGLRRYYRESDFAFLYNELGDTANASLLFSNLSLGSESAFETWLERNIDSAWHDFFVVELLDGNPAGFVYSYEFRRLSGTCKVCCYVAKGYRGTGLGALSALEFVRLLFGRYPLRKIYAEVFGHNSPSLEMAKSFKMKEEGRLLEAFWFDGEYCDQYILSISREDFGQNRLLKLSAEKSVSMVDRPSKE